MAFPRTAMKENKSVISQRDNIEGVFKFMYTVASSFENCKGPSQCSTALPDRDQYICTYIFTAVWHVMFGYFDFYMYFPDL